MSISFDRKATASTKGDEKNLELSWFMAHAFDVSTPCCSGSDQPSCFARSDATGVSALVKTS